MSAGILGGITRDTVMRILADLGHDVREQLIPREFLYMADEVFFSGTAAEITPVRSVDHIQVGDGEARPDHQGGPGPVPRDRTWAVSRPVRVADAGSRTRCRRQMTASRPSACDRRVSGAQRVVRAADDGSDAAGVAPGD